MTQKVNEMLDALKPIDEFNVGGWRCVIIQHVSGPLEWLAFRKGERDDSMYARRCVMPAGMSVADVREDATKTLSRGEL